MIQRSLLLLTLAVLLAVVPHGQAQDEPVVGFVVDPELASSALVDLGPSGLSTLGTIFRSLGAQVETVNLEAPIPDHISLLVLAKPLEPLRIQHIVRLWDYTRQGKNLLLAIDPENYYLGFTNVDLNLTASGLSDLIFNDYGIRIDEAMLIEPAFDQESIAQLETTLSQVQPDPVLNPVTFPLTQYGLSASVWGGRALSVDPLGVGSFAVPLLVSHTGYGETDVGVFRVSRGRTYSAPTVPLQFEIGSDLQGSLNIAALAENTILGSRIAVLGDSELLQNGYGLSASGNFTRFPGDRILVERLAAWLLDLPSNRWPDLPPGFTWLAVDGSTSDWEELETLSVPDTAAASGPGYDIEQVRGFMDDRFAYILVETAAPPADDAVLSLSLPEQEGIEAEALVVTADRIELLPESSQVLVTLSRAAFGDAIELRLPRRLLLSRLEQVCLSAPGDAAPACLRVAADLPVVNTRAPLDNPLMEGMSAVVIAAGDTNIRSGPDVTYPVVGAVSEGVVLTAVGRTPNSAWVQVETAGLTGWVAEVLLILNGDLAALPVVNVP